MKHKIYAIIAIVLCFGIFATFTGCSSDKNQEIGEANFVIYSLGDTVTIDGKTYTAGMFGQESDGDLWKCTVNSEFIVVVPTREIWVISDQPNTAYRSYQFNTGWIYEGEIPGVDN